MKRKPTTNDKIANLAKALMALASAILAVMGAVSAIVGNPAGVATDTTTVKTTNTTAAATPEQIAKAPPAGELQSQPEDIVALRDSTPAGVDQAKIDEAQRIFDEAVEQGGVEEADAPIAMGGAQGYSCRKSYQSRGYGSFRSYFSEFILHYTVSPNASGWQDVYNIKNYLNSVGLSATFVMDFEGHCLQTVPLDRNPYTQGSFNPYGVSVEIIATGKESRGDWLAAPIFRQGILAALVRDVLVSHNLPVRFVDPVGCTPKAGYTDHNHLECGNNHVDVSPNFPFDVFATQVKAAPKPVCGKRCHTVKRVRANHKKAHKAFRKNACANGNRRYEGQPKKSKFCKHLRHRNAYLHRKAKRLHISLKGTF